jgi:hypothetical protein
MLEKLTIFLVQFDAEQVEIALSNVVDFPQSSVASPERARYLAKWI